MQQDETAEIASLEKENAALLIEITALKEKLRECNEKAGRTGMSLSCALIGR